jgi:hypothetical protein
MQQIQTASWSETHTVGEYIVVDGRDPIPQRFWLRTDPPALAWRTEFSEEWSHDVIDGLKHLSTASTWKTCQLEMTKKPITVERLLNHVLFPSPSAEHEGGGKEAHALWQQETVEREGRMVVRWHRETTQKQFHVAETIWTEADTHRIVATERRETDPTTNKIVAVEARNHYVYDAELPGDVFEMPPGKPIVEIADDDAFMPEVWDRLSPREQAAIQAVIHQSEAAWQNADFTAFSAVWNFHVVPDVPRDTEWKERVQRAKSGSRWQSQVTSANTQDFVPVTVSVNTFRWGPERRKVMRVKANLSISWGEGMSWQGQTDYYIGRRGRGFRIVHWEYPAEEINEALQAEP